LSWVVIPRFHCACAGEAANWQIHAQNPPFWQIGNFGEFMLKIHHFSTAFAFDRRKFKCLNTSKYENFAELPENGMGTVLGFLSCRR
jgi:hypothetical protein